MRPATRHIIQRQTVWLNSPDRHPSFGIQERVSVYCRHQLPSLLETLFDRLTDADITLRLDSLTLDVGRLSPGNLESELTERIRAQLEQVLRQIIDGFDTPVNVGNEREGQSSVGRVERLSRPQRLTQLLRHFLQKGYLPAWADTNDAQQIDAWLQTPEAAAFRRELLLMLANHPPMLRRLVQHSSDATLRLLAFESTTNPPDGAIENILVVTQLLTQRPLSGLREQYWLGILSNTSLLRPTFADSLIRLHDVLFPGQHSTVFFQQLLRIMTSQQTATDAPDPQSKRSVIPSFGQQPASTDASKSGCTLTATYWLISELTQLAGPASRTTPTTGQPSPLEKPTAQSHQAAATPDDLHPLALTDRLRTDSPLKDATLPQMTDSRAATPTNDDATVDSSATIPVNNATSTILPANPLPSYDTAQIGSQRSAQTEDDELVVPPVGPDATLPQPVGSSVTTPINDDTADLATTTLINDVAASTLPANLLRKYNSEQAGSRRSAKTEGDDALFVPLAGLVLLHPFLMTLFAEMGLLTTNRQWVDEFSAVQGVQMLAYLSTGQDYCPEYDMPLLKLLCGLPFETVVSPHLNLSDTDRNNAAEVLDAVIGHWNALGNTSAAGLRDAFLQREGKLIPTDAGWRLTVERKTIDILLDRLPWGFSTIKLPVMTDLLFVDWN